MGRFNSKPILAIKGSNRMDKQGRDRTGRDWTERGRRGVNLKPFLAIKGEKDDQQDKLITFFSNFIDNFLPYSNK